MEENAKKNTLNLKNILIIITILIVVIVLIISIIDISKNKQKEKIASKIFGNEECDAIMHISTNDLALRTCKICKKEFQDSSMRADICTECAKETKRCEFCGKKLSDGIKAQKRELIGN